MRINKLYFTFALLILNHIKMAERKKRCKVEKTDVFLDFDGVRDIMAKRGVTKNRALIAEEVGFSLTTISTWKTTAPEVVSMIFHFLRDNMLEFNDLVKESETDK